MSEKAILILPDVGLNEDELEKVKSQFQNNIAETLKRAGSRLADVVVVVVVVVYERLAGKGR
jgi:hypothetical protein